MASIPKHLLLIPAHPKIILGKIQVKSHEQLELYLSDYSAEELRQGRELWKRYAGHKTLIDFAADKQNTSHL